jgi:hypothetical protein
MYFRLRFSVDRLERDECDRLVMERALILEYDVAVNSVSSEG